MARFDVSKLTQLQLDGVTCAVCGQVDERPMIPVGPAPSGLVDLYAHPACVDEEPAPTSGVLCIGPIATSADVKALRALAYNVAYELGRPATYATHADHTATDYASVYLTGDVTALRDVSTLVVLAEALAAHMDVQEPLTADEVTECPCGLVSRHTRPYVDEAGEVFCAECREESGCAWCGEWNDMDDLAIVESGDTFVPLHAGCLDRLRRDGRHGALKVAA
ncbi:hypothetical protein OG985_37180 [Streptomyces sp. NBC_00289]|uniref:hypothetical protein n=1 Tax=Streptomyces sp. NBC_00289 TaxID=2975703 RepID=UPI003248E910